MNPAEWERIDRLADACVHATLESVGGLAHGRVPPSVGRIQATIALRGELKGRAVLAMTGDAIDATCPIPCAGDAGLALDWVCELTNLVIGRLRTELAHHGVSLELAAPHAHAPTDPASFDPRAGGHEHRFELGGLAFFLRFRPTAAAFVTAELATTTRDDAPLIHLRDPPCQKKF